jgi:pyruvate/2-oxoglutarate dehydrogenase complex dihydrolipoamide acyltransferase (E2) component
MKNSVAPFIQLVRAPKSSANDDVLRVVGVAVKDGDAIVDGQILVEIEGAKAVTELTAERSGIVYLLVQHGDCVAIGGSVAAIVSEGVSRDDVLAHVSSSEFGGKNERRPEATPVVAGTRFSKGATELIHRHRVSPDLFAGRGLVTAAMVEERVAQMDADLHWDASQPKRGENGRVVLIGGGYGAHQILSVLLFEEGSQAVAILDEDSRKFGQWVKGVETPGVMRRAPWRA